jgi:hypothetical protein
MKKKFFKISAYRWVFSVQFSSQNGTRVSCYVLKFRYKIMLRAVQKSIYYRFVYRRCTEKIMSFTEYFYTGT